MATSSSAPKNEKYEKNDTKFSDLNPNQQQLNLFKNIKVSNESTDEALKKELVIFFYYFS